MEGWTSGCESCKFTVEFKEAVVRRLLGGENGSALSQQLNDRRGILQRWLDAYRAEAVKGFTRNPAGPPAGQSQPLKPARDRRDKSIVDRERLVRQQAASLHFFEHAFRALNLASPGHDAPRTSGFTTPSSGSALEARFASNDPPSSQE